jgi:pyruvate dehydrogenase E2 component (dihydrolipoamide acetyltransferase)
VIDGRLRAMPLVRKLARQRGIDLAAIVGTGVGGRITRKDLEAAATSSPTTRPIAAAAPVVTAESIRRPLSMMRRSIGAHMTAQWQQVPHITGNADADAGRLLTARKALGARLDRKVPLEALLIAAAIPALRQFPELNASVDGDDLIVHGRYDIGFAVGTEGGLIVPVIRNADRYSMAALIDVVADLTARGRERKLTPAELGDQTFTISNLGPVGGDHATQIIPAGTTAIASFGRIREMPVVRDGAIVVAQVMAVSGTFDHRAVDGAPGMRFLHAVIDAIEEPALLLL